MTKPTKDNASNAAHSLEFGDVTTAKPRRQFMKKGLAALSTLALGETILLTSDDANAYFWNSKKDVYGQRKSVRRANGKGRLKNDYSKAVIKKGVCLNTVSVKYERSLGERKMSRGLVTCHGFK